jgi:hypothetical protein
MRKTLLALAALALLLPVLPAAASHFPNQGCDDDAGYELLTDEGFSLTFDAPAGTAPELQAANHPAVTAQRTAHFYFHTEFAPFTRGTVQFDLSWEHASDYDLFLFDADGFEIARAVEENLETGENSERITITLNHCQSVYLAVRSWAGAPVQPLDLDVTVSDLADPDEDLEPRDDARRFYYLGGDRPGQLAMAHGEPNEPPVPIESALVDERPTGGDPAHYTRLLVGFNQHRNLLQAHYSTMLDTPVEISGDAAVQVWVSSATMGLPDDHEGELTVRLYADGLELGTSPARIPGSAINPWPTPLWVVFDDIDMTAFFRLTVQVSADPVVASDQSTSPPGNAHYTVWYDSVQFPARLMLPVTPPEVEDPGEPGDPCIDDEGELIVEEQQVYIHQAETKAGNLAALGFDSFPTWSEEEPTQSVQDGAGGGYLANSQHFVTEADDEIFGLTVVGDFSGCLDTMLVELYAFLPTNRTGTAGDLEERPFNGIVTVDVDGERVFWPAEAEMETIPNPSGEATYRIRFALTNLHAAFGFAEVEPGGDHELRLNLNPRFLNTNNALFVYDTTEVPSGILFNGTPDDTYTVMSAF